MTKQLLSYSFLFVLICTLQTKGQQKPTLFNDYPSQLTMSTDVFNKIKLLKTQGLPLELIIDTEEQVKLKGTAVYYGTYDDGSEIISATLTEFPQNTQLLIWKKVNGTETVYEGLIRNFNYEDAYKLVHIINGKIIFIKVDLESTIIAD
jgi:hypothetical protein